MLIKIEERTDTPSDTLYVKYMVRDKSNKRLTIILLPGGPGGDHSVYLKQAEIFFNDVNVVMFDPRGCGQSTLANNSCYSMGVYIDDIEAIRQQLGLENIIVLGFSYGSMVAQGYAIKYGTDVNLKALILVAGAPSYQFIEAAQSKLNEIGTDAQKDAFNRLLTGQITQDEQLRDYFKTMAPLYSLAAQRSKTFHSAKDNVRYNADAALAGFGPNGFLRTFDWTNQLANIKCPTLIIVGEKDWINQPTQAKIISEFIPENELKIVSNSGHFIWADQQETYFSEIRLFIARCSL